MVRSSYENQRPSFEKVVDALNAYRNTRKHQLCVQCDTYNVISLVRKCVCPHWMNFRVNGVCKIVKFASGKYVYCLGPAPFKAIFILFMKKEQWNERYEMWGIKRKFFPELRETHRLIGFLAPFRSIGSLCPNHKTNWKQIPKSTTTIYSIKPHIQLF
jgi:hypothetical protein